MRCAILDDYQSVAHTFGDWSTVPECECVRLTPSLAHRDALPAMLADFDIILAMRERTVFDTDLLEQLPRLKLLVTTGMRNASIDLAAAAKQGIVVCGTEGSAGAAAELAWGLLLALMRHIPEEAQGFKSGQWQTTVGTELAGKTLGVVGFGRLGQKVAAYGRAFGMNVLAWSRSLTPEAAASAEVSHCATLYSLLTEVDVVSLHLTLTKDTRGIIGERELALMRPSAVLVNTARGPLVDEDALVSALQAGRLRGAALDVFDVEPLPADHVFRTLPNLLAVSHLGYVTEQTYRIFYAQAVEDIRAWLDGKPMRVLG